jgi:hypothetical protein
MVNIGSFAIAALYFLDPKTPNLPYWASKSVKNRLKRIVGQKPGIWTSVKWMIKII